MRVTSEAPLMLEALTGRLKELFGFFLVDDSVLFVASATVLVAPCIKQIVASLLFVRISEKK